MRDIEQELRSVADVPVPPSTTELDDVLRRGRRRVYALRAGAAAGVVAVVAGAGFTAFALRAVPTSLPPALDGPAVTTTNTLNKVEPWPTADLPPQVPYGTWQPAASAPPGPGRAVLALPLCESHLGQQAARFEGGPVTPAVAEEFDRAVGLVAGLAVASGPQTAVLRSTAVNATSHHRWIDVTDVGGTGSVTITEGTYGGTPLAAADQDAFVHGNCEPPIRQVQDDGTVVQYSSAVPSEPFQSLGQSLRIYRPNGVVVEVVQRNFGSRDFRVNGEGTAFDRFGAGRQTLPLSDDQLMAIGEVVARAAG